LDRQSGLAKRSRSPRVAGSQDEVLLAGGVKAAPRVSPPSQHDDSPRGIPSVRILEETGESPQPLLGHGHLDDLLPGENLVHGAVKRADVEYAGGGPERGSECKPQRASRRHIEVSITPGHLQLLGGAELAVFGPDAFGYVGRSHRDAR